MWHFEQQFGRDIFIEINAVHNWLATWLEPWLLERWLRRPDVRESLQAAAKTERMRPLRVPAEAPLATDQNILPTARRRHAIQAATEWLRKTAAEMLPKGERLTKDQAADLAFQKFGLA